jgi:hypothetical protein
MLQVAHQMPASILQVITDGPRPERRAEQLSDNSGKKYERKFLEMA